MRATSAAVLRQTAWTCAAVWVAALVGCAAPQATSLSDELPFDEAVAKATDGLAGQTQKLPAFLARVESKISKKGIVLDPMLDAATGQQTAATALLETRVTERLTTKFDQFTVLPFQSANLGKALYLLTGTMTRVDAGVAGHKRALQINLALTELKSGNVVAQASALALDDGLDHTPLPYYRDSPVLVKDRVIEGYARTSTTPPGQRADAFYLDRIASATLIKRGDHALQPGALRRGARPVPQCPGHAHRRTAPGPERHLPDDRQARPHRGGRAGVRQGRRPGHRLQRARREVPVQPGQHRVLVRTRR